MADREDREAHGWAPRSRYLTITGDTPRLLAGDLDGAREYLTRVERAIACGGWTDNERTRLHRMRATWSRRASGQDPRFNLHGNRQGGLTRDQQQLVTQSRLQHHISKVVLEVGVTGIPVRPVRNRNTKR